MLPIASPPRVQAARRAVAWPLPFLIAVNTTGAGTEKRHGGPMKGSVLTVTIVTMVLAASGEVQAHAALGASAASIH